MKKIILVMMVALMGGIGKGAAQNQLIATLDHDGEISTFYGRDALINAHSSANHGDVITLSSGHFNTPIFTKAITIRGAGMHYNVDTQTNWTFLDDAGRSYDARYIQIESDSLEKVNGNLIFEGVRCGTIGKRGNVQNNSDRYYIRLTKVQFIKCYFPNDFTNYNSSSDITFVNCRLNGMYLLAQKITCINCIITGLATSYGSYINCVLNDLSGNVHDSGQSGYNANSYFENCCFLTSKCIFPASTTLINCISTYSRSFEQIINTSNRYVALRDAFKTAEIKYYDVETETYELTDVAKTTYLGSDGTQVGIYGGLAPYSPVPSNPQITKFNVAQKATADGKLSVDIAVNGAE